MNHIPQLIYMILIVLGLQAAGFAQQPTSQKLDPNMSLKRLMRMESFGLIPGMNPLNFLGLNGSKKMAYTGAFLSILIGRYEMRSTSWPIIQQADSSGSGPTAKGSW